MFIEYLGNTWTELTHLPSSLSLKLEYFVHNALISQENNEYSIAPPSIPLLIKVLLRILLGGTGQLNGWEHFLLL